MTVLFERLPEEKLREICERMVNILEEVAPNNAPHQLTIVMALFATLADSAGLSITVLLDKLSEHQKIRGGEKWMN